MPNRGSSISQRAAPQAPQDQRQDRKPDFYVRAQVGPRRSDYVPVGVAWERTNGPGLSVKINTLPISGWTGVLKILPPYEENDGLPPEDQQE